MAGKVRTFISFDYDHGEDQDDRKHVFPSRQDAGPGETSAEHAGLVLPKRWRPRFPARSGFFTKAKAATRYGSCSRWIRRRHLDAAAKERVERAGLDV